MLVFPKNFYWGVATSAYQIEGGCNEDGKGASIWDEFTSRKGTIADGNTGAVACDHYHRWQEDVDLIAKLGCNSYRFSVSWPRIIPEGTGQINQKGLDFYRNLVDHLKEKGIEPFVTLYHWDLPLALEQKSGWTNRAITDAFADYTEVVVRALGDRVRFWMTLNEPLVIYGAGYYSGEHAPGYKSIIKSAKVIHNLLLAHGKSAERIHSIQPTLLVGIVNSISKVYPNSQKDQKAVRRAEALTQRLFLDPIFWGHYPSWMEGKLRFINRDIRDDDFVIISHPIDFLGVNNYSRMVVSRSFIPIPGFKIITPNYDSSNVTAMGWEIFPQGIYDGLTWIRDKYGNPRVYITENGAAFDDKLNSDGQIYDEKRIAFLKAYLSNVHRAINDGCNVRGYFV